MRAVAVLFSLGVIIGVILLVGEAGRVDIQRTVAPPVKNAESVDRAVAELNEWFRQTWASEAVQPAEPAADLTVYRRLSLALHGTVPSLEEVRSFEADTGEARIERWTVRLMQDPRFADYFGERLARSLVGTEDGPFIIFRRDRFTAWLSQQLRRDTPWTTMAAEMIAAERLWTDQPASNFITVAQINDGGGIDENKLVGRTSRTFLGQRIDCAQCHDHPFDEQWKQQHFEGLAAYFGHAYVNVAGVYDRARQGREPVEYRIVEPGEDEENGRIVTPAVPFSEEWLPTTGTRRHQLAEWIVHPENQRFERAIANRIWGLLFGRPWHDPVDDLPHPDADESDPLDVLGKHFRDQDARLSSLIRIIAASDVFRLSSESSATDQTEYAAQSRNWAVFPLIRLRPEQVIGSLFQAAHIRTVDQNSNPFIRLQRFGNENDFLREYGDQGDDELLQQVGTIPQALLRMNGRFTRELSDADGLSAAGQILSFSDSPSDIVENCFLACLGRRPLPEELSLYVDHLANARDSETAGKTPAAAATGDADAAPTFSQQEVVRDLFWTLFNSPEFSWNH